MNLRLPDLKARYFVAIGLVICSPVLFTYMAWEGQTTSTTTLAVEGAPGGVIFIADPHLKESNLDHVRGMIQEINAMHPSVVLIGGDFVYGEDPDLSLQQVWREVDAPVYAVLGNHDYKSGVSAVSGMQKVLAISGTDRSVDGYDMSMLRDETTDTELADDLTAELESAGVHVLRNEYVDLDVDGTPLRIVGVDDGWAGMADPPDLPESDAFTIYLIHEPECRADWEADLILAGHTHGGQIMLPGVKELNDAGYLELSGLFQKDETPLYVSRGIGTSNLQTDLRLNDPPEIVVIAPAPEGMEVRAG
ncbi:putative MPP superfamily phosphohydrolase [Methanofollis sp. W23]|uniref:metallophosphoesterase n=1 Tax=Methanofollis sp. W23 TaxID=2817849 RepID=UPI001AE9B418|nr:metallophosphoesterase [Methanofollis sp. W23]MBP2146457.1 putative MPP superfamily phosphohydrolase [Methanofollis sp. W23]